MNKQDGGITAICIAIIIACIIALVHEAKAEPVPKTCNVGQNIILTVGGEMNKQTSKIIKSVEKNSAKISENEMNLSKKAEEWESIGTWRCTTYCKFCNDPAGTQSASGIPLEYGHVAMNGVPLGTQIRINGEVFTVVDRCGIDGTVDIFMEWAQDGCQCSRLDYQEVEIKKDTTD